MTKSQEKIINRINKADSKWTCEIYQDVYENGQIILKFKNNAKNIFCEVSGLMVIGKRGGCRIIGMNVFFTGERKARRDFEKTSASLFCYDVFGYGKHPQIKLI